jgi:hypothetical protein
MQIEINDTIIDFPASLSEITLGQRIEFHKVYGTELEEKLKSIQEMPEGILQDLALQEYHDETAMSFFAFFSGCSIDTVKQDAPADIVLSIYYAVFANMVADETTITLQKEYEWRGEKWELQSPILSNQHVMKFGEFIDAKQILKDLVTDNGSRWDFLLKACCIFLRKPDEEYDISFIESGGEREKLMLELPMDIAIAVGFFLTSSIGLFKKTLASSNPDEADQDTISQGTSTSGDGSTS